MPEIFRFFGFSFFFYSREHAPIHVHVEGKNGYAKFEYDGERFHLRESHGIKAGDMKKKFNSSLMIMRILLSQDGMNILINKWQEDYDSN